MTKLETAIVIDDFLLNEAPEELDDVDAPLTPQIELKLKRPLTRQEMREVDLTIHDILEAKVANMLDDTKSSLDIHKMLTFNEIKIDLDEEKSLNGLRLLTHQHCASFDIFCDDYNPKTFKLRHQLILKTCHEFKLKNATFGEWLKIDEMETVMWMKMFLSFLKTVHVLMKEGKAPTKYAAFKAFKGVNHA